MKVPEFIKKSALHQFKIDKNTIEHIIEGSIVINSIELMLEILAKFPDNPELVRIYADLLLKNRMHDAAAKAYNRAAILFLNSGKMLPAIVAKISQWHIEMPSDQNVKAFLTELDSSRNKKLPIGHFFSKLTIHELKALCSLFENVRLPANQVVKEIGDPEDHLFFIVSGRLRDSIYLTLQNQRKVFRKPTLELTENDFFGDIYPFNKEQRSQSYVETIEATELVRVPKEKLMRICRKYPNIELGIIDLLSIRSMSDQEESAETIRKETRHKFFLMLELEIYPEHSPDEAIYLEGASEDISIGGMSIIVDSSKIFAPWNIASLHDRAANAKIYVSVVTHTLLLKISGKIAWRREVVHSGAKALAIGMQFDEMSPKIRGLLFALFNSLD
ncbi:MAG: cyclic nucleotide-binding domain-containing protein [Deltaproteobacteria bacterium]|nr:cyclic nucleotide-binding domain-containing protein [Deltaproteobacteria bacterium]MBW2469157.1 cyclic nucleotide-binding domain-containing protein [Deltaproteobacteria bacterium]MBW2487037.1 cyclic nucleotide-binding domain-containing protein [Deltaproteobacteria bacterium]MBW2518198.1 cyclic nucleotide-binding domain-containing protein [Deltaproteobacteria bacterium]